MIPSARRALRRAVAGGGGDRRLRCSPRASARARRLAPPPACGGQRLLGLARELARGLLALVGLLGERALDHVAERGREARRRASSSDGGGSLTWANIVPTFESRRNGETRVST